MYAKTRKPVTTLPPLRKETFFMASIKNAVGRMLDAESIDIKASMAEFSQLMVVDLTPMQRYDLWTKFWSTVYTMRLAEFDTESQARITSMRECATEEMERLRSAIHPLY